MRFRPLLLLLPLLLSGVVANSDGNLQNCNIDQKLDGVMPWVQAPVTSAQYSITSPSTNYTPGALTPISIVVNDLDFVYIGLMLVAQNSSGEYIGRWTVMDGDPFFLPSSCAGKAVVHTNADLKSTKHTFYWRGYKGAGTVTFRALIKWGEQATGKFYRPANLQLGEGPTAIPAAALQLGNPGDSCDETCGKKNKACDDVATLGLNSAALLQAQTDQYYVCRRPFLRFCGPPATGAGSNCYYYKCAVGTTFNTTEACSHRTSDSIMSQKFCMCKTGTVVRDPVPPSSTANTTTGLHILTPVTLDAELKLNSLEIQNGKVKIDVSGPRDKWFGISWDATSMDNAYTTVISLNDATLKSPQNLASITNMGTNDAERGWYDLACQTATYDYCRNIGTTFSCATAGTTNQAVPSNYSAASRVPCKDGKQVPAAPMTVTEHILSSTARDATKQTSTTVIDSSLFDGGMFRIVFSRPVGGTNPFPNASTFPITWALGVNQFFGQSSGSFNKHLKRSASSTTITLSPMYANCGPAPTPAPTFMDFPPTSDAPTNPTAAPPTDAAPAPTPKAAAPTNAATPTAPTAPTAPTTAPTDIHLNSSNEILPSMWVMAGLIAMCTKNWVWGALFMAFPASAHNFVITPSRALIASVTAPCQARVNPAPHLQVIPGQKFQLEWTVGHGHQNDFPTYFVMLRERDYHQLKASKLETSLEEYLANAPSRLTGPVWTRSHLAPWDHYSGTCSGCNNGDAVLEPVYPTDSRYIGRNKAAVQKGTRPGDKNVTQFWYKDTDELNADARAQYNSSKYPWIVAVHRFHVRTHWPFEYDMATFSFPGGWASGNYIIHYMWGGYRDCTDVHLMPPSPTQVANPWGQLGANFTESFVRLDHCEYTFVRNPSTTCTPITNGNISKCWTDCLGQGPNACSGIQVVRKTNPIGTMPYTPNFPYKRYTPVQSSLDARPPFETGVCDSWTIHRRRNCADINTGCSTSISSMADSDYMCYGLAPYKDVDRQTVDDYTVTNDPTHAGYYSSCFVRIQAGGFLPYPLAYKPPIDWRVGDKCLDCNWVENTYKKLGLKQAPNWLDGIATDCTNCDISATKCSLDLDPIDQGSAGSCTGTLNNSQTCDAACDAGYNLFGPARTCRGGVLMGANQACVYGGCA